MAESTTLQDLSVTMNPVGDSEEFLPENNDDAEEDKHKISTILDAKQQLGGYSVTI